MEFRRNQNEGEHSDIEYMIPFPSSDHIPTIHTILHDPILFRTFIRCLSTTTTTSLSSSSTTITPSDPTNQNASSITSATNSISTSNSGVGSGSNSIQLTNTGSLVNRNHRKRSMSLSVETSAKHMKLTSFGASPTTISTSRSNLNTGSGSNTISLQVGKPIFNVPILVTTILFSVFEYYDHWPTPLIQAYADDCFGQRMWVDHKLCTLFISNLALVHDDQMINESFNASKVSNDTDEEHNIRLADAAIVAETYRNYQYSNVDTGKSETQHRPILLSSVTSKRGTIFSQSQSISSQSSFNFSRNKSGDTVRQQQQQQRINRPRTKMKPMGDVSSIDSESEDDALSITQSNTMITDGYESSEVIVENSELESDSMRIKRSSSMESNRSFEFHDNERDQEQQQGVALVSTNTTSESTKDAGTLIDDTYHRYPVEQKYIHSERIRNRYYGKNMEAAHSSIIVSLTNRLNVKSKQNSSLLQCLPSFLGIPGVRSHVVSQLDKWLQSPALAGLARSLFSSTVNHIAIVDPPIPEDIHVIDSIIGMKLKSNQVSYNLPRVGRII
jgi:hypothetical protein